MEQAECFVRQAREQGFPVKLLQHDRDTKFTKSFDAKLKSLRVQSIRNAYRSPNTNAYVERFIQSICGECLDRFLVLGLRHMDYLCREYLAYYHHQRPHQSLNNEPLIPPKQATRRKGKQQVAEAEILLLLNIHCEQRLGGLLKSYSRRAA